MKGDTTLVQKLLPQDDLPLDLIHVLTHHPAVKKWVAGSKHRSDRPDPDLDLKYSFDSLLVGRPCTSCSLVLCEGNICYQAVLEQVDEQNPNKRLCTFCNQACVKSLGDRLENQSAWGSKLTMLDLSLARLRSLPDFKGKLNTEEVRAFSTFLSRKIQCAKCNGEIVCKTQCLSLKPKGENLRSQDRNYCSVDCLCQALQLQIPNDLPTAADFIPIRQRNRNCA